MPEQSIVKYLVKIGFDVDGVVERPDLIGAIFGQTEGLFGPEMNLNALQKTWKVGRIEIKAESRNGQTKGEVHIPMSTDISTAALIAAAIENVDKVGPCTAHFGLITIDDVRATKRKTIADRAKSIMKEWASKTTSESEQILKSLEGSAKPSRIIEFGPEKLPAGPSIYSSDPVIVVEGRADVLVLLKAGIDNVVAMEGTKVPESIVRLGKEKDLIAFLDGDRSGDLIQKELSQVTRVKRIVRAPKGKEVEELTPVEATRLLEKPKAPPPKREKKVEVAYPKELSDKIKELYPEVNGALEAVLLDSKLDSTKKIPINELVATLEKGKGTKFVVFDGIVTQRLVDAAGRIGVSHIIGHRTGDISEKPSELNLNTFQELGLE